jgi:hypothetical protein
VRFVRANIKTREQNNREKAETQSSQAPLRTIEEQEDRQFLEKAQAELHKEDSSHMEKEEKDVGRTRALTPDPENPEQVVPNVTVCGPSQKSSRGTEMTVTAEKLPPLTEKPMVDSPTEEKSLEIEPWKVQVQGDGSVLRREELEGK